MTSLDQLLKIASWPISHPAFQPVSLETGLLLSPLLAKRNGFFAFESALLVLPNPGVATIPGLAEWNAAGGWRRHYPQLRPDVLFFAMDVFAGQFGLAETGNVVRLDPESGEATSHSSSLEAWAEAILANYDFETGWSVAKEWQAAHGPLEPGRRLLGRRPFVLGGDYDVSNLVAVPCGEAAEKLGTLCGQIKGLPDGAKVTEKGWV